MLRRHLSDNAPAAATLSPDTPLTEPSASVSTAASREDTAAATAAPAPTGKLAALRPSRWLPSLAAFLSAERHWLLLALPYLAAWWQPIYWCTHEDHLWSDPNQPLIFQPFVAIAVGLLVWQDRNRFSERFIQVRRQYGERGRRRQGSPVLLLLGCLVMLVGSLVHVASLAVFGLLLIAVGIILRVYGSLLLRALIRPLLFSLLIIPPPATLLQRMDDKCGIFTARITAVLLRLAGKGTEAFGGAIQFPDHTFTLHRFASGFNIALWVAVALLFLAVWRRMKFGPIILLMAVGATVGILCNLPRILAAAAVSGTNGPLSNSIQSSYALLIAFPAFGLVLLLERLSRPAVAWVGARMRGARALSTTAEKATNRVTGQAAERLGSVTRAAGSSTNLIERGFKALDKLFKAKRRRKRRW